MPTFIKTVGPGKDFADMGAAATFVNSRDMIANDESFIFDNYANVTVSVVIAPTTWDANHNILVRPAPGLGVNDLNNTGACDYGTVGIEWIGPTFFTNLGAFCNVSGFRITINDGVQFQTQGGGLDKCRVRAFGTGLLGLSNYTTTAYFTNSLLIKESGNSAGLYDQWQAKVEGNTFVNRGTATGTIFTAGFGGVATLKNNAFWNCGSVPVSRLDSFAAGNCANNYTNVALTGFTTGYVVNTTTAFFNNAANDYVPSSTSPLLAHGTNPSVNDLRGNNRGVSPDVGALQRTPATPLSVLVVTSEVQSGQVRTISGTTTGSPTSGSATISPATVPNGALSQTSALSLGTNTFSVQFSNITPGSYAAPTITVVNAGGMSGPATGANSFIVEGISGGGYTGGTASTIISSINNVSSVTAVGTLVFTGYTALSGVFATSGVGMLRATLGLSGIASTTAVASLVISPIPALTGVSSASGVGSLTRSLPGALVGVSSTAGVGSLMGEVDKALSSVSSAASVGQVTQNIVLAAPLSMVGVVTTGNSGSFKFAVAGGLTGVTSTVTAGAFVQNVDIIIPDIGVSSITAVGTLSTSITTSNNVSLIPVISTTAAGSLAWSVGKALSGVSSATSASPLVLAALPTFNGVSATGNPGTFVFSAINGPLAGVSAISGVSAFVFVRNLSMASTTSVCAAGTITGSTIELTAALVTGISSITNVGIIGFGDTKTLTGTVATSGVGSLLFTYGLSGVRATCAAQSFGFAGAITLVGVQSITSINNLLSGLGLIGVVSQTNAGIITITILAPTLSTRMTISDTLLNYMVLSENSI